jgi:hypothetical protein
MASTELRADDDALMNATPMARCPVDDITEKGNCELHQSTKNISIKVAIGITLPSEPGACFHGHPIPASYSRVGVDEVLNGYGTLELEIPAGEGETTLGEVTHAITEKGKHRVADSAPRP